MKFPNYDGGAQGDLLIANALDADNLRPYAEVRHRDQIVSKRDMHLHVEEVPIEPVEDTRTGPFYLSLANGSEGRVHLRLPYDPDYEPVEASRTDFWSLYNGAGERDLVYVGGGYVAGLMYDTGEGRAWPMLWHIDRLDDLPVESGAPNIPARANVSFRSYGWDETYRPAGTVGEITPSLFASGKDSQGRYWFGVMVLDYAETRRQDGRHMFAVLVGNTVDRVLNKVWLPHPPRHPNMPGYRQSMWAKTSVVQYQEWLGFPSKVQCVGPGDLMVLMTPVEPVLAQVTQDLGDATSLPGPQGASVDSGVRDYSFFDHNPLPEDSAPYILRSRDFGQTWTATKAEWLNPPTYQYSVFWQGNITGGPQKGDFAQYDMSDNPALSVPVIPTFGGAFWRAVGIGGGRIAIFYPRLRGASKSVLRPSEMGVGMWVSNSDGTDFIRVDWPGDTISPAFAGIPFNDPGMESPHRVICLTPWLTSRPMSAGPGSLFVEVIERHQTEPISSRVKYPTGNARVMLVSQDFGTSWSEQAVPPDARPLKESWMEVVQLIDPAGQNPTLVYRAPQPETQFAVTKPRTDKKPAELWFAVPELRWVTMWRTNERFDAWEPIYELNLEGALTYSDRAVGVPQLLFVGDDNLSGEYLSRLHVGYPEMGEEE